MEILSHKHVCPQGTQDGGGKGTGAESQIHYSHTEHVWAGCCRLVLGCGLGAGDSCIGTFLKDFGMVGGWWLTPMGGKGGRRAGQSENLTRSLADPLGCSTATKSLQSCPTLCDPIDGSPPGSPVPGILQAETLEWVAISFSKDALSPV